MGCCHFIGLIKNLSKFDPIKYTLDHQLQIIQVIIFEKVEMKISF